MFGDPVIRPSLLVASILVILLSSLLVWIAGPRIRLIHPASSPIVHPVRSNNRLYKFLSHTKLMHESWG